jgi:tripartite-type tricarboxylate transporter receptor subunit TctC
MKREKSTMLTASRIASSALIFALSALGGVHAESWPSKPVRFILPSQAGGSADIAARALAQQLSARWKQTVVVDNRPGAGGIVATDALAKSPPDGYTFGWLLAAHAVNPSLYRKLPYDTMRDFSGVTLLYSLKAVVVTAPGSPANDVETLIQMARSKPGALNFTSAFTGSIPHLVGELFKRKNDLDLQYIAYKGSLAAQTDVIAGRVAVMFDVLPGALPQIRAGRLKPLAVVGDVPAKELPSVPTLPGLLPPKAVAGWNGVAVPAATPAARIAQLNTDLAAAMGSAELRERLAALTVDVMTSSPAAFDAFIRDEIVRWGDVVKRAGITMN